MKEGGHFGLLLRLTENCIEIQKQLGFGRKVDEEAKKFSEDDMRYFHEDTFWIKKQRSG